MFTNLALLAFMIINQTDTSKTISLQEANRPPSELAGYFEYPEPINPPSEQYTIPAKSYIEVEIAPCSTLFVTESVQTGKKKKTTSTTTCYDAYDAGEITNDWGLVIHTPISIHSAIMHRLTQKGPKVQDSGIKCISPEHLELVDSYDTLPEECFKGWPAIFSRTPL